MEAVSSRERKNSLRGLSFGDRPGAGGRGGPGGGEGRPLPGAGGAGTRAGWRGAGTLSEPQFSSLDNKVAGFERAFPLAHIPRVSSCLLWLEERDRPALGWGMGGALRPCELPGTVTAFPALSLHSGANDVFWGSVGPLSQARSTFLNSPCSVGAGKYKGPLLLKGRSDPFPPTFSLPAILTSSTHPSLFRPQTSLAPLEPLLSRFSAPVHLPHGDFLPRMLQFSTPPSPGTLTVALASPGSRTRGPD